ncbi:hypothetical protein [Streptomyces sp. NPDC053048]|uniref:LppU/SCO3897 family protein n=1 Tax=Streptomyces sp. NPDC053048 TaxID=3365694 RepID=UPI0037D60D5C
MPTEATLWLTPDEAASGVTRVVDLPGGPVTIRIPPTRDGSVVKVSTDQGMVHFRIRLTGGPAAPPTRAGRPRTGRLVRVVVTLAVFGAIALVIALSGNDSSSPSASSGADRRSAAPVPAHTGNATSDPDLDHPNSSSPGPGTAAATPTEAAPSPYTTGTCLNGTLPDSTTPTSVSNVDVVSCSASDAHYKVIQTFYGTTDLSRCRDNSDTQYSFSSRTTMGGQTINSYVYCLVGLGSYAR